MHLSCGVVPVWHGGVCPVFEVRECEVLIKRMKIISGEGTLLLLQQLRRYWDSAKASSGQCALGAPRRNGDEMVRSESELLKHIWCSMQVG